MTDNEKAATFIGWKPGQICHGCVARMIDHGFAGLDIEGLPKGTGHEIDAPDMALPQHYMRALDELPDAIGWEVRREVWGPRSCTIGGMLRQPSVVEALALLYDTEHFDEVPAR